MKNKEQKKQITYWDIFWSFFKIGLFTLGGGLAMATIIRHELVLKRKWLNDEDFLSEISIATAVPGSIAVNIAFLQGRHLGGKIGALAAILGTILPSFLIILFIAWFALPYFDQPIISAFFKGCALAVSGQLAYTGYIFGRKLLKNYLNILICLTGLLFLFLLKIHPIWVLLIAAIMGYFSPGQSGPTPKEPHC